MLFWESITPVNSKGESGWHGSAFLAFHLCEPSSNPIQAIMRIVFSVPTRFCGFFLNIHCVRCFIPTLKLSMSLSSSFHRFSQIRKLQSCGGYSGILGFWARGNKARLEMPAHLKTSLHTTMTLTHTGFPIPIS